MHKKNSKSEGLRPACPGCKIALGKHRLKQRHIDSLQGWIEYERMRWRCRKCKRGCYPLDHHLQLAQGSQMSLQKERQVAKLTVRLPYEEAKEVYEDLTGFKVAAMTAHRVVQRLGARVGEVEVIKKPKSKKEKKTKTHLTADGVMISIREEGWKEAKVGSVYEVDEERKGQGMIYTATLENREIFGHRLYRLAGEPETAETGEVTFTSDAARWLDELQALSFPLAIRIVDFWHVTEYLWEVANTFYQEGTRKSRQWAEEKVKQLRQGEIKAIQNSLCQIKPKSKKQREILEATQTYFENHGHQMDYPRYEAMGLHIGSGIAESACKFVIQARFKRSGMKWSRSGAENLLRLRLAYLNDQWDELLDAAKN